MKIQVTIEVPDGKACDVCRWYKTSQDIGGHVWCEMFQGEASRGLKLTECVDSEVVG